MATNREMFRVNNDSEDIVGSVNLNERERKVWDKGWADGQEYMRQIHVRNGYAARGMRVPGTFPSELEREKFLEHADSDLDPYSEKEDEICIEAFNNACLAGHPILDS